MYSRKKRKEGDNRCICRGECGIPHDKPLMDTYDTRCESELGSDGSKDVNRCRPCYIHKRRKNANKYRRTPPKGYGVKPLPGQKSLF